MARLESEFIVVMQKCNHLVRFVAGFEIIKKEEHAAEYQYEDDVWTNRGRSCLSDYRAKKNWYEDDARITSGDVSRAVARKKSVHRYIGLVRVDALGFYFMAKI